MSGSRFGEADIGIPTFDEVKTSGESLLPLINFAAAKFKAKAKDQAQAKELFK